MKVSLNLKRQHIAAIAAFAMVFVLLALFALSSTPTARAQSTATNTPTLTPTNTPVATVFPMAAGNGFVQFLTCGAFGATVTPGDCVQINNGGTIHVYDATGKNTFAVDGATGAITTTGRIIQGPLGIKCVNGTQNVTGSATVIAATPAAAGISTPVFVQHSLDVDPAGNYNLVTHTNAAGVVTLKVWGLVAQTPVASTTTVAVDYVVCGQ